MTVKLKDLKIQSKNSADNKELMAHIHENMDMIQGWVEPCWAHDKKALIVSAGSSLQRHLPKIKKKQKEGYEIFCIKHSLPVLVKAGINPTACVMLDPRPLAGYSTHGVKREELYETVSKDKTLFLVASMTNPSVTKHLFEQGLRVVGWHAAVTGLVEVLRERQVSGCMVHEGTSSATRSVGLLKMLGFRHIELVAFDSDVVEPTPEQKRERNVEGPLKYTQVVTETGDVFWSTGELMAQVQDIKNLVKIHTHSGNLKLSMWEGGLGYTAFTEEKKLQELILNGGGLEGVTTRNYSSMMNNLYNPISYKLVIEGSDGRKVQTLHQGAISNIMHNLGLNWEQPVVH